MNDMQLTMPPHGNWRSRARASAIHATASVAVAALAALLVFRAWYPWPYTTLAGGLELFVLVCSVDVVLGPVITFAIFDRAKGWPVLRRDLAIVVLLQLSALVYGLHVVFIARPVALALEGEHLSVISAIDVVESELPLAPPGLQRLPFDGPRLVRTVVPSDPDEKLDAIMQATSGVDLGKRPRYWRAWDDEARREALAVARPLERLQRSGPGKEAALAQAIARTGREESQLRYLPVLAKVEWVALIDASSGDPVGFAPLLGD